MTLNPGDILKGDFWPEPGRVLTVTPVGERFKIEAVGTKSQPQQFYSRILSKDDIDQVVIARGVGHDFGGDAQAFFLAMEAHRIRYVARPWRRKWWKTPPPPLPSKPCRTRRRNFSPPRWWKSSAMWEKNGREENPMFRRDLPPAVRQAVEELRQSLARLYGERFAGLYLYGSYARGDFREESDVDLLLLLKGEVNPMAELNRLSEMLSDLCLRYDVLIAVYPVPEEWLMVRKSPLFENVRREGVAL